MSPPRIILSRKGFDSGYGGMPSPILPDGRMVPLPIPAPHDRFCMRDADPAEELSELLSDLSRGQHSLRTRVHLDPDLDRPRALRADGWRPALGQTGAAQSHLWARGVGPGDVFLFFGWFRAVKRESGRWRYATRAPHLHVLFGWLEVDVVLPIVTERARCVSDHPWIADHPHVASPAHYNDPRNTLYVAARRSRLVGGHAGGGRFRHFDPNLQLTAPGRTRSIWSLPRWFMPEHGRTPLSYHQRRERWVAGEGRCYLRSVAKGQEFVLDVQQYPEARAWVTEVVRTGHSRRSRR